MITKGYSNFPDAMSAATSRPTASSVAALSNRIEARRDEIVHSLKREAELCRLASSAAMGVSARAR